ncbi:putative NAD binding Rossmann fold oxidoreductase [Plectosphaerella cucumerina]|uniref:NAD binding Rossmann fold oxidoreductase n=1 Tax=Plectosphaerella cucumerina TaxID=40658 RepID=A0A8K0TQ15_9PEZI|nr:putative NAD binding Rossmann fold oxidoreductase [Plectosphaerella cucumerina]
MATETYRVGVIGYGLSAKVFQIPYILASSRFRLQAIVQRSGDEAARDHSEATIHRSANDLFANPNVDLVVVSTPPQSHYEFVSAALTAGKHVVVEKPFCPTSAECDKLIALAKSKGKHLAVFQNRRWDVDFVTLRHLLSEGRLGRVVEFASHYDRFDPSVPPRDAVDVLGSGVIFDLGTHLFDQVLQLYGSPEKVTAFLSHQRPGAGAQGPEDACTVLLHYPGGLLVTVKASPLSADEAQLRFWVRGEKGSFKKYHIDPQEPQLVGGMKTTDEGFGYESADKSGLLTTWENGVHVTAPVPNLTPPTYAEFYNLLALALDGKGRLPVTAEEARDVIKLVELSKESSRAQTTLAVSSGDFLG